MTALIGILIGVGLLVAILLASAIRILREYERGVVFRLGRLVHQKSRLRAWLSVETLVRRALC